MSPFVVFHISFGRKCFLTDVTHERFFICVDPHVDYQIRPLRKSFIAILKITSEWLGPKMQMHMSLESAFPRKAFRANVKSALESRIDFCFERIFIFLSMRNNISCLRIIFFFTFFIFEIRYLLLLKCKFKKITWMPTWKSNSSYPLSSLLQLNIGH